MPRQPAKACPEGQRYCPDCAADGLDGCRPIEEFGPPVKAARYKGGVRYPAYCKRHAYKRETTRRVAAPEGSATRTWMREAGRRHYQRHKDDPDWKTNRAAIYKAYRGRNPAKLAALYKAWAERNPEQRKASIAAFRARHRVRRAQPPPSEPTDE